jgi:hypothetical protein
MVKKGKAIKEGNKIQEKFSENYIGTEFAIGQNSLDLEGKDQYLNCLASLIDPSKMERLENLLEYLKLTPAKMEDIKVLNKSPDKNVLADVIEYFRIQNDTIKFCLVFDLLNLCKEEKYSDIKYLSDKICFKNEDFVQFKKISFFFKNRKYEEFYLACAMSNYETCKHILDKLEPTAIIKQKYVQHLHFDVLDSKDWNKKNRTNGYFPAKKHVSNYQFSLFLNYLFKVYEEKIKIKADIFYFGLEPIINLKLSEIVHNKKLNAFTGNDKDVTGIYPEATLGYAEFVRRLTEENIKVLTFYEFDTEYSSEKSLVIHYFEFDNIKELIYDEVNTKNFYFTRKNESTRLLETSYYILTNATKPFKNLTFRLMKKVK